MIVRTNHFAALGAAAASSLFLLAGCGASTAATNSAASNVATSTSAGPTTSSPSHMGTTAMPTSMMSRSMISGSMMSPSGMPMPAQPAGPHNQADITFAQQMTVHHRSAITMADLAATRAASPKVKTLAQQIKAAQAPEISEMAGWLAAWAPDTDMNGMPNKSASSGMGMGGMGSGAAGTTPGMPGMMTDAQMSALAAATGTAFDKMFLQMMIVHHQGALTMAATESAHGSNPEASKLAASITASQAAQISQMQEMLKTM